MLFIAIGLIILFLSFFVALVMLIRELGQRVNIDDSIDDFPLDFADVVVSEESGRLDSDNMPRNQPADTLPQETRVSSPPSLDEVVPFPWETDAESSLKGEDEREELQEAVIVSNEPVSLRSRTGLNDQFSLSDLAKKD